MKTYILTAVIVLFSLSACQKLVDADKLLQSDKKVFIRGYLSPQDTVLRIHVSRVFPSIGTPMSLVDEQENIDKFLIRDAQVMLSDEFGNNTQLNYVEDERDYTAEASSLEILGGQNYFLSVSVDGETYTASCHIPERVDEINERILLREDDFGGMEADIDLVFDDIEGERNFYVLGGLISSTVQYDNQEPQNFEFSLFFDSDEFLTDALEDGATLSGNSLTYVGNGVEVLDTQITLQVANVEEVLFQSFRSSSINSDAEDNPFVEYSIAPNNVLDDGAVGVFAGYQLTKKTIDLEL